MFALSPPTSTPAAGASPNGAAAPGAPVGDVFAALMAALVGGEGETLAKPLGGNSLAGNSQDDVEEDAASADASAVPAPVYLAIATPAAPIVADPATTPSEPGLESIAVARAVDLYAAPATGNLAPTATKAVAEPVLEPTIPAPSPDPSGHANVQPTQATADTPALAGAPQNAAAPTPPVEVAKAAFTPAPAVQAQPVSESAEVTATPSAIAAPVLPSIAADAVPKADAAPTIAPPVNAAPRPDQPVITRSSNTPIVSDMPATPADEAPLTPASATIQPASAQEIIVLPPQVAAMQVSMLAAAPPAPVAQAAIAAIIPAEPARFDDTTDSAPETVAADTAGESALDPLPPSPVEANPPPAANAKAAERAPSAPTLSPAIETVEEALVPDASADPTPQPSARAEAPVQAPAIAATTAQAVRGSPETVAHLASQIAKKLETRTSRFDLELYPAGLGKVEVRMEIGAQGRVTAAMSFENPQAAADMRTRSAELQRTLEQAGFDLSGGLSFDVAGDRGQSNRENAQQAPANHAAQRGRAFQAALNALDAPSPSLSPALRRWSAAGVDVRI